MLRVILFGPWQLNTYNLLYALAATVTGVFVWRRLRQTGFPSAVTIRSILLTVLGAYVGSLLIRVVLTLQEFLGKGTLRWPEGGSYIGALAGGSAVAVICCRIYKMPLGRTLDLAAPPFPLGQAIGRIGCFAAGCCYGRETSSWLGMYLPDASGVWSIRYPTQLTSAAADLLIFAALLVIDRMRVRRNIPGERRFFDGFVFLLYLGLYFLKRLSIEFLRGDSISLFGPVSWVHFYTCIGVVTVTGLIIWNLQSSRRATALPASTT